MVNLMRGRKSTPSGLHIPVPTFPLIITGVFFYYYRMCGSMTKDKGGLTLKWPRYFYSRWCPRGVPWNPPWENHFPTRILQWNLHHICTGHKKSQFCKKNILNVIPFQNGGQKTDFCFASFWFWPNFEKPLSQRNFSMKFGSKKENMNRLTLLK